MELIGDTQADIAMTVTVPHAINLCHDLVFQYNHAVPGVETSKCAAYFKEGHLEHTLTVQAKPTFGCNSEDTSLMEFKPYDKDDDNMWTGYKPSNITVQVEILFNSF